MTRVNGWRVLDVDGELVAVTDARVTGDVTDLSEGVPTPGVSGTATPVEDYMAVAADTTAAIEAAIVAATAANTRPGRIVFEKGKTYTLTTRAVRVERSLLGLDIDLNDATIKLTSAAPRAFDFYRVASGDTFQNVALHDGTVDADSIGGKHHVIIGNCIGFAAGTARAVNFDNIRVERVRAINVPQGTDDNVDLRVGVAFQSWNNGDLPDPQNTITDVVVEDVDIEGGIVGIQIAGFPDGAVTSANVWIDNCHVRGGSHVMPAPTGFRASNHIIIGNKGWGGWCTVTGFKGEGSGDCGIEINAIQSFHGRDIEIKDSWNHAIYNHNYHAPLDAISQVHWWGNVRVTRSAAITNTLANGLHYAVKSAGGSYPANVIVDGFHWEDTAQLFGGAGSGDAILIAGPRFAAIKDFYGSQNFGTYNGGSAVTGQMIYVDGMDSSDTANRTNAVLDNVRCHIRGTKGGAGAVTLYALRIGKVGFTNFRIEKPDIQFAATSCTCYPIALGDSGSTPTIRGTVDKLTLATSGASSTSGIRVFGTATTTIAGAVTISDPDFSRMQSSAVEVEFAGASNAAKTQIIRPRWRNAKTPSAITVTASPFSYQNLDGYTERVVVRGGTVSLVELTVDGTNYEDLGVTAGAFLVEPGATLRVTYSAAPTMRKVPPVATAVA